jgi:hypothetical protein
VLKEFTLLSWMSAFDVVCPNGVFALGFGTKDITLQQTV